MDDVIYEEFKGPATPSCTWTAASSKTHLARDRRQQVGYPPRRAVDDRRRAEADLDPPPRLSDMNPVEAIELLTNG